MMRSYKKVVDNVKTTGAASLPKPAYYEEINALVQGSHAVNPTNLYDSGRSEVRN